MHAASDVYNTITEMFPEYRDDIMYVNTNKIYSRNKNIAVYLDKFDIYYEHNTLDYLLYGCDLNKIIGINNGSVYINNKKIDDNKLIDLLKNVK